MLFYHYYCYYYFFGYYFYFCCDLISSFFLIFFLSSRPSYRFVVVSLGFPDKYTKDSVGQEQQLRHPRLSKDSAGAVVIEDSGGL